MTPHLTDRYTLGDCFGAAYLTVPVRIDIASLETARKLKTRRRRDAWYDRGAALFFWVSSLLNLAA